MDACNTLVLRMGEHVKASRRDSEIESVALDLQTISTELEVVKRENREDVERFRAVTGDLERVIQEKSV